MGQGTASRGIRAIVLAAGVGNRLRSVTGAPKCLLEVGGRTLLVRYLDALQRSGITEVAIVVGFHKEMVRDAVRDRLSGEVRLVDNPDFAEGSVLSLNRAAAELSGGALLMDGDVYFEEEVLRRLVAAPSADAVAIDTTSKSTGEEMMVGVRGGRIVDMGRSLTGDHDLVGEAVGFFKLGAEASQALRSIVREQVELGRRHLGYEDVLPHLFRRVRCVPVVIDGLRWVEIDFEDDLRRARQLARETDAPPNKA